MHIRTRWPLRALVCLLLLGASVATARAEGKVSLYGVRMVPHASGAERFSRAGWGGGMQVVAPVPQVHNLFAGVLGFEYVNMLSETIEFFDPDTYLRVEQQTAQHYLRVYLGPRIGPHGKGLLRPHVGVNLALVSYGVSTDIVVPDDVNRENEIRQNLHDENHIALGYDITTGLDLNLANKVAVDGGVRYLKSFNVPQQLGGDAVTVYPQYFQVYLGVGLSFGMLKDM
jgi:opacity protein-like surface antigen